MDIQNWLENSIDYSVKHLSLLECYERRKGRGYYQIKKEESPRKEKLTKLAHADTEKYIMCTIFCAIIFFLWFTMFPPSGLWIWFGLLSLFTVYRLFEILSSALHRLLDIKDADSPNNPIRRSTIQRGVILLIINYFEVMFWFAAIYALLWSQFDGATIWLHVLQASFTAMSSFQQGYIHPITELGLGIMFLQTLIGWFMTLLILAGFVNMLASKGEGLEQLAYTTPEAVTFRGTEGGNRRMSEQMAKYLIIGASIVMVLVIAAYGLTAVGIAKYSLSKEQVQLLYQGFLQGSILLYVGLIIIGVVSCLKKDTRNQEAPLQNATPNTRTESQTESA